MTGKTRRERFEEICQDIWNVMLVLVSYGFFCILVLLQPDEMTLKSTGTVQMPFAQVSVNFSEFELFGPLVLVLILLYLHFLLGKWHDFETEWRSVESARGDRFFFNLSPWPARGISLLIFYGSGPIVFTWFVYKIRAWPCVAPWEIIPSVATALLLYRLVRNYPIAPRWKQICVYAPCVVAILAIFLAVSWPHVLADCIPLHLEDADLSGQNLRRYSLRNVNASGANLKDADLGGLSLQKADFSFAHLEGADFTGADLAGAGFNHAHLEETDFENATLTGARFEHTGLSEVKNLKQDQLAGACGDKMTIDKLPPGYTLQRCSTPAGREGAGAPE